MSYTDGWAALNLQMPRRVPRTEYSIEGHWEVVSTVTGQHVTQDSPQEARWAAQKAFYKAWKYDFHWSVLIGGGELDAKRTRMGHAVYAAGGVDKDTRIECPFTTPEEALQLDPMETYGKKDKKELIARFEKHYRDQMAQDLDSVRMTGVYITCISGLIDIFGWDMLLLAAGEDPEGFGELTNRYCKWIGQYFEALAEADVPVVMIHDDIVWTAGPFISPAWYRKYVFPNYKWMFAPLRESGKKIVYTSDGNYTMFIDDVAAAGVHAFVLEPLTDMRYIAEKYGKTHAFIGNADTRILLSGTKPQIRAEVERCMAIGKSCPGFFMAVGNHIPSNTPVENALYYNQVYEELARR
jgi:hypothetical protein